MATQMNLFFFVIGRSISGHNWGKQLYENNLYYIY